MDSKQNDEPESCQRKVSFPCSHCWKTFKNERHMLNHQQLHRVWRCNNCSRKFGTEDSLQKHKKNTCELHPFKCKTYSKKQHTTGEKVKCSKCDMKFRKLNALKYHMTKLHGMTSVKCDECGDEFNNRLSLIMHKQIHAKGKDIPCTKCDEKFTSRYHLRLHQQTHKEMLPCCTCYEQFYEHDRSAHINLQHSDKKSYHCFKCGNSFPSKGEFKDHKIIMCKTFDCELCDMKFADRAALKKHIRNDHMEGKPHKCEFCDERFEKKGQLLKHEQIHGKDKLFVCKVCSKRYSSRNSLKYHQKVHTEKQLPTCKFCQRTFVMKYQLAKHELTHTEGKPFKCDLCPKSYTTNSHLQEHMRVHLKNKSFQCEHCGKLFPYKQSLKVHVRKHTGEKPYICILCNSKFSESRQFQRHRKSCTADNTLIRKTSNESMVVHGEPKPTENERVKNNDSSELFSNRHSKCITIQLCENVNVLCIANENSEKIDQLSSCASQISTTTNGNASDEQSVIQFEVPVVVSNNNMDKANINQLNSETDGQKANNDIGKTGKDQSDDDSILSLAKLLQNFSAEVSKIGNKNTLHSDQQSGLIVNGNESECERAEHTELKKYERDDDGTQTALEYVDKIEQHNSLEEELTHNRTEVDHEEEIEYSLKTSEIDITNKVCVVHLKTIKDDQMNVFKETCQENVFQDADICNEIKNDEASKLRDSTSFNSDMIEVIREIDDISKEKNMFICKKCKNVFQNRYRLNQHQVQCGLKKHECKDCNEFFLSSYFLSKHIKLKHTKLKPLNCDECSEGFLRSKDLKMHKYIQKGEFPFTCCFCEVTFPVEKDFIIHMNKNHSMEKPYKCSHCTRVFKKLGSLKEHLLVHSKSKPFKCDLCDKSFKIISRLKSHMRIHENVFVCKVCNKKFAYRGQLVAHEKTHLARAKSPEILDCEECGKVFQNKRQMKRHWKFHKYGRPFLCKICGRKFVEKWSLVNHEKIHTDGKAHQCKLCQKQFDTIGHLKEHFLVHSGEKPFQCETCGKRFGFRRTLRRHLLVHTGEKPYQCNICDRRFPDAGKVRSHQKRIHADQIADAYVMKVETEVLPGVSGAEDDLVSAAQLLDVSFAC